ncbi:hypothetical protein HNE_1041 [Hyphomonas neptunium ATCC 15444]|uniref:Cytochrome C oxidase assembly protein n=2 Tax=Hyphomonas TaxID=85 RepID=Q0C3D0_HYPNA|nr:MULTISPECIES: hypothetical protein [Hyphomonas]ABI78485.1 hypothetical protein HNE_1041 [Hyphomonas neptunium ATCC 15444]KCZ96028.1 hypothetical protein HHI_00075 [Hyphomonas hirschiana VP5]
MEDPTLKPDVRRFTPEELAARKKRNVWLGLALGGFVVLVMITTVIRLATGTGISGRM